MQLRTGSEDKFTALTQNDLKEHGASLFRPRRELTIRRGGKRIQSLAPVFPGYVFLQTADLSERIRRIVRTSDGFIRFLDSTAKPRPLSGDDLELVKHFMGYGEIVRKSSVTFDANQRIVVVDGPLKGLEGRIIKVNRRKGRAKVQLDMYNNSFTVDFGFDVLESTPDTESTEGT
ncbi:MAG: antiterminator LoaP [Spirochaetaceae bacterium]